LVGGDRVHPSDVGQYLMACICLAETGADGLVDETRVDAAGRTAFTFGYSPKALPLPVTDLYRAVEKVWPVTERLNREMLMISNLPRGTYAIKTEGREIGRFAAEQLAKGVNLALLDTPNRRVAEQAEPLRARLHKIASDFRSVIYLVQWMKQAKVSFSDPVALKAYFAQQRERAKTLSWGGWHRHCVDALERMIPQWKALEAEEESLRERLRTIRPVASQFTVQLVAKADGPVTWRLPPETVTNGYCRVTVDGRDLDVFALPKPPKHFDFQREADLNPYGAVFFDSDRESEVVVTYPDGNRRSFRAKPPFTRVVENTGRHDALVVCANLPETDAPDRNDQHVKWFGPGMHRPRVVRLCSGDTLYLAPGAVLEAPVIADGNDIVIRGRGIISGIPWPWGKGPEKYLCRMQGENIVLRDIAFAGSWYWTVVLNRVKHATIDSLRILCGKVLNDDGIDICRSDDVVIRNSFIRTQDDCIAPKWWCTNLTVENCQLWTDYANIVRLGWECDPKGGAMRGFRFRDLDVLHLSMEKRPASHEWFNSCFSLQASAGMPIRDILCDKVRIRAYEPGDILFVAYTGDCGNGYCGVSYKGGGTIDDVTLSDISAPDGARLTTRLSAEKPGQIGRIVFDNVTGYTAPELVNATGLVTRVAAPYSWRGLMLDEGRFFFGKAAVKATLDRMAACGLNVFHWHLTEDQGWRLEIRRFPELTRIGAVRPGSPTLHSKTETDSDGKPYGPFFYTTEDVREVIAYAAERNIRVVPEIEIPGHIKALLAAHPEFSCTGKVTPADMIPMGVQKDVLCAGNDAAIRFLEQVFDEVCELFPDEVVHIGGDECPKDRWKQCPKCQARIRQLGLRDEKDLQAWVTHHFANYLAKKGKRAMGWDEILEGEGCPTNVIVQSWRPVTCAYFKLKEPTAITAARRGFDVVLSPMDQTYLSVPFGKDDPGEYRRPVDKYDSYLTEEKVRAFRPDKGFPPELRGRILGAECCCWSEGTRSPESLDHKTWPRAELFSRALQR